jgi:hypothetical protein
MKSRKKFKKWNFRPVMEEVLKVRRLSMRKTVLIASLTIVFLTIPFLIRAEVYKWIDDKGDTHFTDDYSTIPEKYLPAAETQSFPQESSPPSVEGKPTEEKPTPALAPKSSEPLADTTPRLFISGVISTVGAGTIVVTGEGNDMVFLVSEDTKIIAYGGKDVPFAELKAGMSVTVEYMKNGDDIHPLSIRINTMPEGVPTRQKTQKK